MNNEFLDFYEKELAFIKKSATEYAKLHPKVGSKLNISDDAPEDPYVERLLNGVAMLNARVQHKLKDDFPELTDALLGTLYPHYQRPIPSFSIAQFAPKEGLDEIETINSGTALETEIFQEQTCQFSTCYPVDIAPFNISSASLMSRPFVTPGANQQPGAGSVLHLRLKTLSDSLSFSELAPNKIRLFLNGQPQHTYPLHEYLLNNVTGVVMARSEADTKPEYFSPDMIKPVGFELSEGLLPYPENAFIGYRLLTELFAFPQKFLFIDITFDQAIPKDIFGELNLYFYLSYADAELEHFINASTFELGCTPIVNLFESACDPIRLDHKLYHYRVVPDNRRKQALEIYSVNRIKGCDSQGNQYEYTPFNGINHAQSQTNHGTFWFDKRIDVVEGEHNNELATEIDISLVDLDFNPYQPHDEFLDIALTCLNRNLPAKLPTGKNKPTLTVIEGHASASSIHCITPPTQTIRPPLRNRAHWRLISHLNLNHLSLSGDQGLSALKEVLRLYNFKETDSSRSMVESIHSLNIKPITAPITVDQGTAMCRGSQIELVFDPRLLIGGSGFLFASVLERFFALYSSINSFTRVIAKIKDQEGDLKRWPPRAGEKALL